MTLFYENLRHLRLKYHLSQQALSDKLHVSLATVGRWERNLSLPSVEKLLEIAVKLNTSLDELVGLSPGEVLDIHELTEAQQTFFIHLARKADANCLRDYSVTNASLQEEAFQIFTTK